MEPFDVFKELVFQQIALKRLTSDNTKDLIYDSYLKSLAFREQFMDSADLQSWTYRMIENIFAKD